MVDLSDDARADCLVFYSAVGSVERSVLLKAGPLVALKVVSKAARWEHDWAGT